VDAPQFLLSLIDASAVRDSAGTEIAFSKEPDVVIAAWGAHSFARVRVAEVAALLAPDRETPADRPMLAIVGPPASPAFESATATSRDVIDQTCH